MVSAPGISRPPEDIWAQFGHGLNHKDSAGHPHGNAMGVFNAIDAARLREKQPLSGWSASLSKRLFDAACVLLSLPVTLPLFLLVGIAVRFTSRGPVLFKQQRMGRSGQSFTIYKFRTMPVRRSSAARPVITTSANQRFTAVGPFLRRWKLDELPQLFNVLRGDMSLVGPRPKVPSHQANHLNCRPGITGRATVVFAREEVTLANIPVAQLDTYYHGVVLPLKQILDDDYMATATFASDLKLLVHSVFRRWEDLKLSDILPPSAVVAPAARTSTMRVEVPHPSSVLLVSQKAAASPRD